MAGAGRRRRKRGAGGAALGDRLRLTRTPRQPGPMMMAGDGCAGDENRENVCAAVGASAEAACAAADAEGCALAAAGLRAESSHARPRVALQEVVLVENGARERGGGDPHSPSRAADDCSAMHCAGLLEDTPPKAAPRAGATRAAPAQGGAAESCCLLLPETPAKAGGPTCEQPAAASPRTCETSLRSAHEARGAVCDAEAAAGRELVAQSAVSADGLWVRREVFEQARKKAKSDLIELENELMGIILAMEAAASGGPAAPAQWDEAGVGGWVRREVLEQVKIKAKQVRASAKLCPLNAGADAHTQTQTQTQTHTHTHTHTHTLKHQHKHTHKHKHIKSKKTQTFTHTRHVTILHHLISTRSDKPPKTHEPLRPPPLSQTLNPKPQTLNPKP